MYTDKILVKMSKLIVMVVIVVMLVGCKDDSGDPLLGESKETLVGMINKLNSDVVSLTEDISELETKLTEIQEEKGPTPGIQVIDEITGKKTFTTVNDTIAFPTEFKYPGSVQAPNTSSLNITEAVKIVPTNNWICQINGTTLELNHSSGITGIIKVGTLDREAQKTKVEDLESYMSTFFSELPAGTIQYSRLYLKDTWFGLDATNNTSIDSNPAMIRCGILGYGEVSIQYTFVYSGERDAAKDEVILSLIKSMQVWNVELSVE